MRTLHCHYCIVVFVFVQDHVYTWNQYSLIWEVHPVQAQDQVILIRIFVLSLVLSSMIGQPVYKQKPLDVTFNERETKYYVIYPIIYSSSETTLCWSGSRSFRSRSRERWAWGGNKTLNGTPQKESNYLILYHLNIIIDNNALFLPVIIIIIQHFLALAASAVFIRTNMTEILILSLLVLMGTS